MKEERRNHFIHKLNALEKDELELFSQMLDTLEVDNRQDQINKRKHYERIMKEKFGIGIGPVQMIARDSLTLKKFPIFIQGVYKIDPEQKILINSSGEEYKIGWNEIYPCLIVQEKPEGNQSLEYLEPGKSFYIGDTFFYMSEENVAVPDKRNLIQNVSSVMPLNYKLTPTDVILRGWYYNFLQKNKDLIVESVSKKENSP